MLKNAGMMAESNLELVSCLKPNMADSTSVNKALSYSDCLIMISCDLCKERLPTGNTKG